MTISRSSFIRAMQVLLVAVPFFFVGYRAVVNDTGIEAITPQKSYEVTLQMDLEAMGGTTQAGTYLPRSTERQPVEVRRHRPGPFELEIANDSTGRRAQWKATDASGPQRITYAFRVWPRSVSYQLGDAQRRPSPGTVAPERQQYLRATETIPVDDPYIESLHDRLVPNTDRLLPVVRALFEHAASLESAEFSGSVDAITADRLGRASCNGVSRLLVALARTADIPSRLVGGLILEDGTKTTSHQWAELYIGGHWVPFDALNGHFATLPAHYLTLYRGDEFLFRHTPDIGFDYQFDIESRWTSRQEAAAVRMSTPSGTYGLWAPLVKAGLSLDLLRILLLLPFGASIVVFFRNVVGLETYGTFLPALIASACLATGLVWGLLAFFTVTLTVAALHVPLERAGILHTPRFAILMVFVVIQLLLLTALSVHTGWFSLSYFILFPVVILTSTAERFASHLTEDGPVKAAQVTFMTSIVIACSYAVMNLPVVGLTVLAFPEVLFLLVAFNLWLGRWVGIRVTEYARFRWLIDRQTTYAADPR